jgi:predicted acyl esterase
MTEPFAPGHHDELPGRWVAEPGWPGANVETQTLKLTADGGLTAGAADKAELPIRGQQTAGLDSGWVFSTEQRTEDRRSLSFTSEPLPERIELLGSPRLELVFASDRPLALASVRLCDVALTMSPPSSPAASSTSHIGTGTRARASSCPASERVQTCGSTQSVARFRPVTGCGSASRRPGGREPGPHPSR